MFICITLLTLNGGICLLILENDVYLSLMFLFTLLLFYTNLRSVSETQTRHKTETSFRPLRSRSLHDFYLVVESYGKWNSLYFSLLDRVKH